VPVPASQTPDDSGRGRWNIVDGRGEGGHDVHSLAARALSKSVRSTTTSFPESRCPGKTPK
jgi:hypothetical protein